MRKSTQLILAVSLLSIFTTASLSALADDHKKAGKATSGMKTSSGSKGFSAKVKGIRGGSSADVVNGAVDGAVGGAISGAVGGLLGAFGPK